MKLKSCSGKVSTTVHPSMAQTLVELSLTKVLNGTLESWILSWSKYPSFNSLFACLGKDLVTRKSRVLTTLMSMQVRGSPCSAGTRRTTTCTASTTFTMVRTSFGTELTSEITKNLKSLSRRLSLIILKRALSSYVTKLLLSTQKFFWTTASVLSRTSTNRTNSWCRGHKPITLDLILDST